MPWDAIEPNLSRLYPKRFDYAVGKSGKTESRPLFGDLIEAMYYYLEKPESDGVAPHFAPGARMRRVIFARVSNVVWHARWLARAIGR